MTDLTMGAPPARAPRGVAAASTQDLQETRQRIAGTVDLDRDPAAGVAKATLQAIDAELGRRGVRGGQTFDIPREARAPISPFGGDGAMLEDGYVQRPAPPPAMPTRGFAPPPGAPPADMISPPSVPARTRNSLTVRDESSPQAPLGGGIFRALGQMWEDLQSRPDSLRSIQRANAAEALAGDALLPGAPAAVVPQEGRSILDRIMGGATPPAPDGPEFNPAALGRPADDMMSPPISMLPRGFPGAPVAPAGARPGFVPPMLPGDAFPPGAVPGGVPVPKPTDMQAGPAAMPQIPSLSASPGAVPGAPGAPAPAGGQPGFFGFTPEYLKDLGIALMQAGEGTPGMGAPGLIGALGRGLGTAEAGAAAREEKSYRRGVASTTARVEQQRWEADHSLAQRKLEATKSLEAATLELKAMQIASDEYIKQLEIGNVSLGRQRDIADLDRKIVEDADKAIQWLQENRFILESDPKDKGKVDAMIQQKQAETQIFRQRVYGLSGVQFSGPAQPAPTGAQTPASPRVRIDPANGMVGPRGG